MPHFFSSDIIGLTASLVLGLPLIVLPGFALGFWLDLFDFRKLDPTTQWPLALVIGIASLPILIYLPFRLININAVYGVLGLLWLAAIGALRRNRRFLYWGAISRGAKIVTASWLILGSFLMLDVAKGKKLYPSSAIIDQSFRSEVIASLAHADQLPPVSYFYYPGRPVHFRYHYLLFLIGALTERFSTGLVSAHVALTALSLWAGLALIAIVAIFIEFYEGFSDRVRATRMAWTLLVVGGLDVLPVGTDILYRWLKNSPSILPFPDIEWWNGWGQIFSWIDTAVWQPHHLTALTACLYACLLLWHSRDMSGAKKWASAIAAGLAFASASGTSIYVTCVFFLYLLLISIELLLNAKHRLPPVLGSGVVATLAIAPLLLEFRAGSAGVGAALPFGFALRPFQPLSSVLMNFNVQTPWAWNLGFLLLLPLNYLMELGVFLLGGIWWIGNRRKPAGKEKYTNDFLIGLCALSFLLCTFAWSGTESSNDFGYRGILPAQFVLLLMTTLMATSAIDRYKAAKTSSLWRTFALALAAIGVASSIAGAVMLRGSIGFSDAGVAYRFNTLRGGHVAERLADLRSVYEWLALNTSSDARLQENPEFSAALALGQYSDRPTVAYGPAWISSFVESNDDSQDKGRFNSKLQVIRPLYMGPASVSDFLTSCSHAQISYVIVQDADPIWADRHSYVWTLRPVIAKPRVRVFACSPQN